MCLIMSGFHFKKLPPGLLFPLSKNIFILMIITIKAPTIQIILPLSTNLAPVDGPHM